MYLLAIGCMIESRLAGKACVSGDITVGQCRKAVRLANQYLSEPIGLPDRCELELLYQRVRGLPLSGDEQLAAFQGLYLGVLDRGYGIFIKTHFSPIERAGYWLGAFKAHRVGTPEFSSALKRYLNQRNGLGDLCKMILYTDKGGTGYYEQFVKEILETNLHLEKKDLRDGLEIQREVEAPYTIYALLAQLVFVGAKNHNVDAHMPLNQIMEILTRHLGERCDVRGIIKAHMKQREAEVKAREKEKPAGILGKYAGAKGDPLANDTEPYDIVHVRDLLYYEKGDKVKTSIKQACISYLKSYKGMCNETFFGDLMKKPAEDKITFLAAQKPQLFLMKRQWLEIFETIREDPESFRRYYPMVRLQLSNDTMWLVYAYVVNEDFYHYLETALGTQ